MSLVSIDSKIDKYQTGALSTTCGSSTDAVSYWTLILCAGFLSRLSSWLFCQSFC